MKNSFALKTGYTCARMETYQFGTFEGLQIIPFSSTLPNSLFDQKPHVMLVGPNGAGKTTLMDALWALLMPDERLLRLGVVQTASPTKGPRGVRKVSEYVLGKHLSTDEQAAEDESKSPFLRKTGTSIIIAVFVHRETGRAITLGRVWWYSDYHVKDESVFFVAREEFSIATTGSPNLMSDSGAPYDGSRNFIKGIRASFGNRIDVTTNGSDYFRAYSDVMGGISKEDIILLMKAANAKDVESVDSFVREYMLVPYQNESVETLEEQVRVATSIATKIEKTTEKMNKTKEIVTDFTRLEDNYDLLYECRVKKQLISLFEQIGKQGEAKLELDTCSIGIAQARSLIPGYEKQRAKYKEELRALNTVLLSKDEAVKSSELQNQISTKNIDVLEMKKELQTARIIAEKSGLSLLAEKSDKSILRTRIEAKIRDYKDEESKFDKNRQDLEANQRENKRRIGEVTDEIRHLERNQTLIPIELYQIKTDLIQNLGISKNEVMFVGELITVPKENAQFEKAAKAVLNPIARRLLVHPDHLERVDYWLNKYKNKATITIQRLGEGDLQKKSFLEIGAESVLKKIVIRDQTENIFFYALHGWLRNDYDFRIVEVEEFHKHSGKVVTLEGYIKSNPRQSTKFKENLETPLGWDIVQKKANLKVVLADERKKEVDFALRIDQLKNKLSTNNAIQFQLEALSSNGLRFLEIPDVEAEIAMLEEQLKIIETGDSEYKKLKLKAKAVEDKADDIIGLIRVEEQRVRDFEKREVELGTRLVSLSEKIFQIKNEVIDRESSLQNLYRDEEIEIKIQDIVGAAKRGKDSISDLLDDVNKELNKLNDKGSIVSLSRNLRDFEKEFHDPNMEYLIKSDNEKVTRAQANSWRKLLEDIEETELPSCRDEWNSIYTSRLFEAIKDFVNDRRKGLQEIEDAITLLNEGISDTIYEMRESRPVILQLFREKNIKDERVRKFERLTSDLEEIFGAKFKSLQVSDQAHVIREKIEPFTKFMEDGSTREFVIDPRNHFIFSVKSFKKLQDGKFDLVETFRGSAKDKKSGGQTVQLCYTLLGMALAQRFHFHDSEKGLNTPRLIVLDEFADKLDNEKPSAVIAMYRNMGFQGIVLSPFSKVDLLRPHMNKLIAVNKDQSTSHSRAYEFALEDLTPEELEDLMDEDSKENH